MAIPFREEVVVLVKAVPQVGVKHGETVCCAGVTFVGQWRRLFPVRFRQLGEESKFVRWQRLSYKANHPTNDLRPESRRVHEESLTPGAKIKSGERSTFINRIVAPSAQAAAQRGQTLCVVRPTEYKFYIKPRKPADLEKLRASYRAAGNQTSFLDRELAAFDPPPYHFRVRFLDADGWHDMECGDWETIAAYRNIRRSHSEDVALKHLLKTYNEEYQERGAVVALGTVHKRPRQWLLLGMIRADFQTQPSLF